MPQKLNKNIEHIKESVCQFYLDNKVECDLHYNCAESDEIGAVYEEVVDSEEIKRLFLNVSVVILTANKYEKNILHYNIYDVYHKKIKRFKIDLFSRKEIREETYAYWFQWESYTVLHIEAQRTGSYTIGGSADIVRYVIKNVYMCPKVIISLGICFGTHEDKYKLGDVVISKKVYPYFIGTKIGEKNYFANDDNMFKMDSGLSAKIKIVIDENAFKSQRVYFDNYITGEAVISNLRVREKFVQITKQEIIAGEMEGYGLFKECNSLGCSIPCSIIKSICDWAAMKNFDTAEIFTRICNENQSVNEKEQKTLKDRIQAYAAFQAYKVMAILISKRIFEYTIYEEIARYVVSTQEKVLHANILRNKIKEMLNGIRKPEQFFCFIIEQLVNEKLLIYHGDDFKEILKSNGKIWKCTFSVGKEK